MLAGDQSPAADAREQVRREMRMRRRAVTAAQQARVARGLAQTLSPLLRSDKRIAVYLHRGREADLSVVIAQARRRGCKLYVPVVTDMQRGRMEFVRFDAAMQLHRNRLGIFEPRSTTSRVPANQLDLVLLPLLAVDSRGWRLGQGAGFYDRRLRHLRDHRQWRRPRLIGIAYEFQRVPVLQPSAWDVPVDAVATDRRLYPVSRPS
ncbi:MAG TPA: 5-formyltetrahydrofolate cyclo-ligase [Povalibacter sp.]|nr:5-formyltetrahydrofolate cyclo-ligase [Povalibacter sp.]